MPLAATGKLDIYVLNVGQADTSVVTTPEGHVLVVDAVAPAKLVGLLRDLGLSSADAIDHLVITHPHSDHFRGANRLVREFRVSEVTLAPFWHQAGIGPATYVALLGRLQSQGTKCHFLSGYSRWYPDGATTGGGSDGNAIDATKPYVELLGPSNALIGQLQRADALDTNHLSVMCRLSWDSSGQRPFRMVFAADAQMENWSSFDAEGLLDDTCQALKAAHHGSANGTQWERLQRLRPQLVVIPAAQRGGRSLPDLIGAAVFSKYSLERRRGRRAGHVVGITGHAGTIRITVSPSGRWDAEYFRDGSDELVNLSTGSRLDWQTNPTDWMRLLASRVTSLP